MLIAETTLEDVLALSTPYNNQASLLPVPFGAALFTGAWGGIGAGQMFVAFSWSSQTLVRPDTSTLSLPAPPAALSLVGGDLGQVAGGTRGATTLWARRGLVKDGHICALSGEQSLAVSANNVLTVAAPTNPGGYDGWCVLVGPGLPDPVRHELSRAERALQHGPEPVHERVARGRGLRGSEPLDDLLLLP